MLGIKTAFLFSASRIMEPQGQQILREALVLPPIDQAEPVEQILASFEFPARQDIDAAWAQEAEDRIDVYERGDIGSS
jgi:hypothetical protein